MPFFPAAAGDRRLASPIAYLPPAACRVMALPANACRWPIGETGADEFHFCSALRVRSSSYCAVHTARARGLRR